jgi:transcriptional regulator GlxA family with amidase domain
VPDQRLLGLLQILTVLATDRQYQLLSSPNLTQAPTSNADRPRIDRLLEFIHARYQQSIRVEDLAEIACLSPSGFHRLFRRHTRLTLGEYVAHLRIGQACTLLTNSEQPIAFIADAVGYASLANFNRQFKMIKALSPRAFRQHFRVTAVFISIEKIERQIFSIPTPPLFVSTRPARLWLKIEDSRFSTRVKFAIT